MSSVTLKSRIPEIRAEIKPRVEVAMRRGSELIAVGAASRAPVSTGTLRDSIEAKPHKEGMGIYAAWYAHFVEFGTTSAPAHPFLIPALESGRAELVSLVSSELKRL